jgi:hypothetical protein
VSPAGSVVNREGMPRDKSKSQMSLAPSGDLNGLPQLAVHQVTAKELSRAGRAERPNLFASTIKPKGWLIWPPPPQRRARRFPRLKRPATKPWVICHAFGDEEMVRQ